MFENAGPLDSTSLILVFLSLLPFFSSSVKVLSVTYNQSASSNHALLITKSALVV